jgi:fibronectin-binding autotransporter adhesin
MRSKFLPICLLVFCVLSVAGATNLPSRRHNTQSAGHTSPTAMPFSADNWLGGTGNWSNNSAWSAGLPGSGSDVTINTSSDYVTLDTSSNINSLTLGGSVGYPGTSTLIGDGNAHTLNIAGPLTVNQSGYFQLLNDTVTAGSVTTSGQLFLNQGSSLTVNGDVTINNAGALILTGYLGGGNNTLNVSGTVTNNSGGSFYVLGQGDVANVGQIVNHYYVQIGTGATLNLTNEAGLTDIAYDADYIVQGTFTAEGNSALASLTTLEGALVLENGQNTNIAPLGGTLTLNGASGGFGGSLLLDEGTSLHVNGNFNALYGGISVGFPKENGSDSLYITGNLTLQPDAVMLIQGQNDLVSVGSLTVMYGRALGGIVGVGTGETLRVSGDLTNSGCIGYCAVLSNGGNTYDIGGTFNNTSTGGVSILAEDQINAAALVNSGFIAMAADARINAGSLTLNPGSGLGIGITGPNDFAMILATGSVALNGELFVNVAGYDPPVGTEFKFLTFTPGSLSGTFSSVVSNGESFIADYDNSGGYVALIAEGTGGTVPEPGSFLLFGSGVLGVAAMVRRRLNR